MLHNLRPQQPVPDETSMDFVPPENEGVLAAAIGIGWIAVEAARTGVERIKKFGCEILDSLGVQK